MRLRMVQGVAGRARARGASRSVVPSRSACAPADNTPDRCRAAVLHGPRSVRAERHKRASGAQVAARLELLGRLPIVTEPETQPRAFREILTLARTQRLTTYDAAYLELAMRRGIALATRDKALVQAARHLGVETLAVEGGSRPRSS